MLLKTLTLAVGLAATTAHAHTRIYAAWVNGVDQGDGRATYIRSPPNNNPVKDLTSPDIACNVNGGTPGSAFVSAAAGDTISMEWYHNTRNDDIIDSSHKGPIQTYITPYTTTDGATPIWTKIDSDGYDSSTKLWAVDNLISNAGKKDFVIPSTLAPGQYLIRQEIIALHEADVAYTANAARGAQFYPSCVQFQITGSGSATPTENFDFNTGYTETDPGIVFNLYSTYTSYTAPGPVVWSGSGSSSGTSSANVTTAAAVVATSSSSPSSSSIAISSSTVVVAPTTTAAVYIAPTTLVTSVLTSSSSSTVTSSAVAAAAPASSGGFDECDA